jgi:organic hydroperoxide reductase OsmC/OhrA
MPGKTAKPFFFEVQLNWLTSKKGILSAADAEGTLHVATPPRFGGEGRPWTPEHFFLSAISSCFMTTYLAFADKQGLAIAGLACNITGEIEITDGRYRFTRVDLHPAIHIDNEELRGKATSVLEKTHKYCLIANSVSAPVFYHSEILITSPGIIPQQNTAPASTAENQPYQPVKF